MSKEGSSSSQRIYPILPNHFSNVQLKILNDQNKGIQVSQSPSTGEKPSFPSSLRIMFYLSYSLMP